MTSPSDPLPSEVASALDAKDTRIRELEAALEWTPMPPPNPKHGDHIIGQFPHGSVDIVCIAQYSKYTNRWFDLAQDSCVAWPNGNDRAAYFRPLPKARAALSAKGEG